MKIIFIIIVTFFLYSISNADDDLDEYKLLCIEIGEKINTENFNKCVQEAMSILSEDETLNKYKSDIIKIIQTNQTYPKKAVRRRIEGIVYLLLSINTDGKLLNVNTLSKTNADKLLVDAAINAVRKSSPFPSSELLKEQNIFHIKIIYKID